MELPDSVNKQHMAELALMLPVFTEAGYHAELIEANDDLPLSTLVVGLGDDDRGRARSMTVNIMPFGDDSFASTTFIQFYVPMPFQVDGTKMGDLGHAIALVNGAMAVGHWAVRGSELFFRYMLAFASNATVDNDMLGELVPMLIFHQEHFADFLEGVLDDEVSLLVLPKLLTSDAD
jgi:hypothetical protein